jgi:uncharacterized protein DUF4157
MRWPFRRPAGTPLPPAEPEPAAAPAPRPAGASPGRRAWQTLPPLVPVVAKPRITVAAPNVTMTRSLLHRPAMPARDARPVGRVDGLADVLPALDVDDPARAAPAEPIEAPRPVRAVPRPVERPPLTAATSEYVGEAREAAEPYRAPAWLRALSSGPVLDPLFGVMLPGPQQPARPVAAPRPPARPAPTVQGAPPRRPLRPRGRLGLGAPLRPDAAEAPDAEPEPAGSQALAAPVGIPALPALTTPPAREPGSSLVSPRTAQRGITQRGITQPGITQPGITQPGATQPEVDRPEVGRPPAESRPLTHTPALETRPQPAEAPSLSRVATPPPAALARDVVAATGVDLDRVLVHRGPDVDRQATRLDAAAFAADDQVHLGSAAGHDDGPEARALIAHELVHIAQQRQLRGAVPDEASPDGVRLEAEAVAVEQAVRESRPLPALAHPRPVPVVPARAVEKPVAGRPVGVLSQPALAGPVPQGVVVRGRVQRRPLDLDHAPSLAGAAQPAAPAPAATPPAPAPSPATPSPAEKPKEPAVQPPTTRQRFAALGEGLGTDLGDMVLASWSLEQGHDTGAAGSGGGASGGGNSGAGANAAGANGGGSRQEQFNRLARPALDRMNEERAARGEHPLAELPQEEEQRIWRQVDQGVAGGGAAGTGGTGQQQGQPIRSWHDLGTAVGGDLSDMVGSSFGLDVAELARADTAASAAATGAATGAGAGRTDPHHDQHKKIEPDDIDLDELSHRLYDRIRSRLRLELLLDRERAGLLSDFR